MIILIIVIVLLIIFYKFNKKELRENIASDYVPVFNSKMEWDGRLPF